MYYDTQVGHIEKPGEQIYELACAALQCDPERVLHVGHDPIRECWHADQAGCTSVLWGREVFAHEELWSSDYLGCEEDHCQ